MSIMVLVNTFCAQIQSNKDYTSQCVCIHYIALCQRAKCTMCNTQNIFRSFIMFGGQSGTWTGKIMTSHKT